jgi:Tfp pilus assembly protein PilF
VLRNLKDFYAAVGRPGEFVTRLQDEIHRHPQNRAAMEFLVQLDASEKKDSDAVAILDSARAASGNDPDLLYYLAHLYDSVGQHDTSEQVLASVIQINPNHAAANNDLGYSWADEGKNLNQAEAMIRIAVDAEPDNESFLDSLGWVLYKRGQFAQAKQYFDRAIAPASLPDPTVLDHLGDTLYRLNDLKQARQTWDSAMKRIVALAQLDELDDEHTKLRGVLIDKLKQAEAGKPVTVAPIAQETTDGKKEEAKN